MKWKEAMSLSEGSSILKHIASCRLVLFIRVNDELTGTMIVRFVDERLKKEHRVAVSEFTRLQPPAGTVARTV